MTLFRKTMKLKSKKHRSRVSKSNSINKRTELRSKKHHSIVRKNSRNTKKVKRGGSWLTDRLPGGATRKLERQAKINENALIDDYNKYHDIIQEFVKSIEERINKIEKDITNDKTELRYTYISTLDPNINEIKDYIGNKINNINNNSNENINDLKKIPNVDIDKLKEFLNTLLTKILRHPYRVYKVENGEYHIDKELLIRPWGEINSKQITIYCRYYIYTKQDIDDEILKIIYNFISPTIIKNLPTNLVQGPGISFIRYINPIVTNIVDYKEIYPTLEKAREREKSSKIGIQKYRQSELNKLNTSTNA